MSKILQIVTKHPENRLHNDDFKVKLKEWWQEKGYSGRVFDRYMPLTGVEYRHTCYPIETMREQSQTFTQKNKTFNEVVHKLSLEAVLELDLLVPEDVCMITSTTMTGVGIPTVPHKLLSHFDFPDSVIKIPMFGLACNGGTHVIQIADEFLKANPTKVVICLTNDLVSMNLNPEDRSLTTVFGITIFGDGVSAILMAGDDYEHGGWKVLKHASHILPDTEDFITLEGTSAGLLYNVESTKLQELPKAADALLPKVEEFIKGHDIDHWICHPGGKVVLQNTTEGLNLPDGALDSSFEMFRLFGNMSATSVIKTLQNDFMKEGKLVMISYGPGFQVDLCLLEKI
jgi:alkylresorcinol/alkylpyrone synthase